MSAVTAIKFHGSQIAVLVGFADDSPAPAITGISQADPAVVTSVAHGLEDGDVVEIEGVVGMTEVNGGRFIVDSLTTDTFSLRGVDSTGYGAWSSGGTFQVGEFSNFCNLTNYNQQGGSSPEIDTTALCSVAQEYLLGLPDFGTTQIDYNFVRNSAIELAVTDAYRDGSLTAIKVVLPEDHGTMVQMGFIQQMSVSAGVGGKWEGSLTMRNTGNREDFDAAP